ncbi:magnesium/cobalt transporter CorA [Sinimarinibacterium thermocellulolyticum]|uniref:Magnesium transport protein CorA n=1 Tax=Sinimarinibacterium thermocellulolyticum TaxID=3170016 RepID=A0ABV2A756_9GAMM
MIRLFRIDDGAVQPLECGADALEAHIEQAHWIDAQAPDEGERALLQRLLQVDLPDADEVDEIEPSARCFCDPAGIHVYSLYLAVSEGRHRLVTVACILQSRRLITIRDEELADFRLLRMRIRRRQIAAASPADLLMTLLEQKVENHADMLEDQHRELERVSQTVLEDRHADLGAAIARLAHLEDSNGKVRLCLMDTQRDLSFLLRHLDQGAARVDAMRETIRDVETLMSHTTFLFDKINFLMDSTQGFINIEQNQIIKIFSIAAVVFLPPTLVASIYGMNFDHMPELKWLLGYPWALGLMLLSGIAPYLYFKRKGWLRRSR